MKQKFINRVMSLLLALVCVMGLLPLSAFAAGERSSAPGSITQKSSDYMKIGGQSVRYKAASSAINNVGLPYVFDEQVEVPGYGATRALCAYQKGTLGPAANGQKWNYKNEVDNASLKVLLTYIYSHTYGNFTDAGNAVGLEHWNQYWSDIWFMVAQAGSWLNEHGTILDVNSNREGFIEQMAEEFVAAMKLYHRTYGQSSWITDWDSIGTHSIIDSKDGGVTGYSAYDYVATGVNLVLDHPEYYNTWHLWLYEWDKSQPWKLAGQSGVPMQHLLIAVPEERTEDEPLKLTVKKLEAGTNKPMSGVTFSVKSADGSGDFSVTRATGADGTLTLTDADGLTAGQYTITEETVPEGYVAQTASQLVTVLPNSAASSVFTFYNEPERKEGDGSIRKVDADDPTNDLSFENDPKTTLVIEKYITGTTTPIKGVTFLITDSSGALIGSSNGEFITDENGRIVIEGLEPGVTITAKEIRTLEGYVLDTTPKSIKIKVGEAQTLRFYNQKQGCVVIRKLDKQTKEPLAGVEFQITYADGSYVDYDNGHLSSKGIYKTDSNGEIRISGVSGTLVITETKTLTGYVMDESTRTQSVKVNPSNTQYITVYNTKIGGLTIIKKDEETGERIKGVQFEIRRLNGEIVGTYTTDTNGVISLPQADKGWYQVVELKAAEGYKLDDTPHQIEVKDGQTVTLEITNRQSGSALIHKVDSLTGEGIYGVTFLVSDAKGNPIGTYQSDNEGYVYIDKELADGKYTIREIECADGYILDTQPKTFYVQYGGCTTITWPNTAVRGQIQIVKKSADYNSANGLPAGTPLAGATFEIYNERNGIKVDTIVTDKNGLASSKALPLGRYTIKETKAPANYGATNDTYTAVLEHSGQIVKLEITNKSVSMGVSIEKTGPKEAMRGQPVRYVFSGIGNTSNVTLESFYWRDTLPAEVKLDKIVTGTYNFPGNYKIVYKVNNAGEYRTLADNLSTSKNYTLAASPVALGLASNQRVTEIMFVFGQAPGGFSQVEQPMIYCTALSNLAPGSSFVNVADVGGTYNGVWQQAVTRWVTNVYGKPIVPTLPKTGY